MKELIELLPNEDIEEMGSIFEKRGLNGLTPLQNFEK